MKCEGLEDQNKALVANMSQTQMHFTRSCLFVLITRKTKYRIFYSVYQIRHETTILGFSFAYIETRKTDQCGLLLQ